jgi:cell division protein FtsW (lipid II flippase)
VLRMWPAAAIAAPWLVLRRVHMLTTDLARGSIVDRLLVRVQHTGSILRLLIANAPDAATWLLIVAALALTVRQWKRERLVLLAVAIQLAFLTGAYFVTNREVVWHVATSWPRLTRQIAAPLVVIVMLMLARTFAAEDDLAHAEARPDL